MISLVILILFVCLTCRPQSPVCPPGIPYLTSAQYSPAVTDPFTCAFNPATLPFLKGFEVGLYSEKRYMTEGLNFMTLSAALADNNKGASLLIQYFGSSAFNEKNFGINYGRTLGRVNIGASFQYNVFTVSGYSSKSALSYGVASIWQLSEKVFTCIQINNPRLFYSGNKEKPEVPSSYSMGVGLQASSKVYLGLESIKEEGGAFQLLFSLHYYFEEKFFTRFCWSTGNNQPFFSAGWKFNDFRIEAGCSYHMTLGASPSLVFIYQKSKSRLSE